MRWLVTLLVLVGCEKAAPKPDDKVMSRDGSVVPVAIDAVPAELDARTVVIDAVEELDKPDVPACPIKACDDGDDCKSTPCRCEDGTSVNMRFCQDGCCAPEEEACTHACTKHDGPKGTWNEARDGRKTGRACRRDDECASKICKQGYCSRKCTSFGDCPPFWDCAEGRSAFDKLCTKK